MPGENCAFPKCITSRKDKGISLFKVPTPDKTNDESIKWTKDLIDVTLKYRVKGQSLIKRMQPYKLYICEKHFTPDQIYVYPTRKMLKEGALPTLNLPRESASSTTKPRPVNAIEKREEYQLLQEQMPQPVQNAYKSFEDFTSRIKSLALTKSWKIEVKEQLVVASLMSSDYVLPVYEIFVDNLLNFTVRVHSWVLPDNHELIQSYNASFNNVTLSKFIERLSSYKLCSGITLPDTRKEIKFIKHVLSKVFDYFDYKTADL